MDGLQEKAGPIAPQQCGGGKEDAAAGAAPAAADATGDDIGGSVASVLGLPECIISEILGERRALTTLLCIQGTTNVRPNLCSQYHYYVSIAQAVGGLGAQHATRGEEEPAVSAQSFKQLLKWWCTISKLLFNMKNMFTYKQQ